MFSINMGFVTVFSILDTRVITCIWGCFCSLQKLHLSDDNCFSVAFCAGLYYEVIGHFNQNQTQVFSIDKGFNIALMLLFQNPGWWKLISLFFFLFLIGSTRV